MPADGVVVENDGVYRHNGNMGAALALAVGTPAALYSPVRRNTSWM